MPFAFTHCSGRAHTPEPILTEPHVQSTRGLRFHESNMSFLFSCEGEVMFLFPLIQPLILLRAVSIYPRFLGRPRLLTRAHLFPQGALSSVLPVFLSHSTYAQRRRMTHGTTPSDPALSTSELLDEQPERRHITVMFAHDAFRQFLSPTA
jgi:hypothetical protein